MFLSLRMHARHWSNPLGRYFFQDQTKTTDRASDPDAPNQRSTNWRRRCDGHCGARPRCRWAAAWPEQAHAPQAPPDWRPPRGLRGQAAVPEGGSMARTSTRAPSPTRLEATAWPAGPGRGAGGRRQGQGGPRDRPLRAVRLACGDLAGGPPPTGTHSGQPHQGRPHGARKSGGARNTRGATSNNTREQTVSGRAAAHRHTQRPGPSRQATRRPEHPWVHKQRRRSGGSASGTATTGGRKAYSPRNALIAGISRTACTRPAR